VTKAADVVGLYIDPPAKAIVLCVDEKPKHLCVWGKPLPMAAIIAKPFLPAAYTSSKATGLPECPLAASNPPLLSHLTMCRRIKMHKLLVSTIVSLALVVPALAQDAPGHSAAASTTQSQQGVVNQGVQSFEQRVQRRLTQAGFNNIEIVPTSILIRAMDSNGNPVLLALSSDSLTKLLEVPGGQNDGSGGGTPSRQPAMTAPNAGDTNTTAPNAGSTK
jgi:hypothetical protein